MFKNLCYEPEKKLLFAIDVIGQNEIQVKMVDA